MKTTRFSPKRIDRPQRLLEAAASLITIQGYNGTTIEAIALQAGVSKGAVYLSWSSKEALFDALLEHEMNKLLLDLRSRIENEAKGCTFTRLYAHSLLALQASPLISALYLHDGKILGDFVARQDPDRYTRRLMLSTEAVRYFQSAGLLRADLPANSIAYLFSLMALGLMSISSVIGAEQAPPLEETIRAMSAMVEGGLISPAGEKPLPKEMLYQMLDLMLSQNEQDGKK
ncbi:MAG: TetR/AcrR family transcriptional regulator [Anaerolineaceae bacterium]|nr:TetR/AcrR family transcriptional regulator [Anaerolineaceae bacterium]